MATTTKRVLLISEGGEIQCTEPGHAPLKGSGTWFTGGWRPMTLNERVDFEAEVGRAPSCETCDAIARRSGGAA